LLRSKSIYRVIPLHRQDNTRTSDRGTHLPAIDWKIEFLYIGSVPVQDFTDDNPEIRGSTDYSPAEEGHLIIMAAPVGAP
jgi:hypothetical protein